MNRQDIEQTVANAHKDCVVAKEILTEKQEATEERDTNDLRLQNDFSASSSTPCHLINSFPTLQTVTECSHMTPANQEHLNKKKCKYFKALSNNKNLPFDASQTRCKMSFKNAIKRHDTNSCDAIRPNINASILSDTASSSDGEDQNGSPCLPHCPDTSLSTSSLSISSSQISNQLNICKETNNCANTSSPSYLRSRVRSRRNVQRSSRILPTDDVLSVISEESLSSTANSASNASQRNSVIETQRTISSIESSGPNAPSPNRPLQLEDPWVMPHKNMSLPASYDPNVKQHNLRTSDVLQNSSESQVDPLSKTEHQNRIQFRTASQNELENIEVNNQMHRNMTTTHHVENDNVVRERERNDLDLLARPSWCDAKFALSRIEQGKANGNKAALKVRTFLHHKLFWLGCKIQKHASVVFSIGVLILAACSIGLKQAHMETNIEKLWIESGGELEEELQYTKAALSTSGSSDPSAFSSGGYVESGTANGGSGYSYQMLIQTGDNTISVESLKLHLKAAVAATKVTVAMYNQTWGFSDVCYKEQVPLQFESGGITSIIFERLFPCFIITPLDCFWEGAKLLGPDPPIYLNPMASNIAWTNLNPLDLLDKSIPSSSPGISDQLKYYRDVMIRAGISSGYTERWCLDPHDIECPQTASNYKNKEIPDVESLFTAGCSGFATNFMQWPLDLILGGVERSNDGSVTNAKGLQTLFSLMGAKNMYEFHQGIKTGPDWSIERAESILKNWERKFAEKIYELAGDRNVTQNSKDTLYAFTVTTTDDILNEFSQISLARLAGGCLLMMGYACYSLIKCRASRSQGAVGIAGVILVMLSVAGGLGICSLLGISFNAASTQVLPFLLLGLGVDDMFLMAHHFGEISVLSYIPFQERTGECLKRVGVSVFLTSIAILSGFLCSIIIPMPALRAFGLQAIVVTAFNLVAVLIIFPAILSIDLIRRKNNKLDIICCFDSATINEVVDLRAEEEHDIEPYDYPHMAFYEHRPIFVTTSPDNQSGIPGQTHSAQSEATITMHHTIQAYSNNSIVTVLEPSTETTVSSPSAFRPPETRRTYPVCESHPCTPPPEYTETPSEATEPRLPPPRPRVAFVNAAMSEPSTTGYSTPVTGGYSGRTSRRGNGSGPPTNLTTPMESVRSSTHSLVSRWNRSRRPCWWRRGFGKIYTCMATLPKFTLSQLGERYYAPFLLRKPVRMAVLVLFLGWLGVSIYGATLVRDGLDFGDILPRGTREHAAVLAQTTFFSFQNMFIVTKSFDYASNQKSLQKLHDSVGDLRNYVMRNTDGTLNKFWLEYFREWLQDLQDEFDKAWAMGSVNNETWISQHANDKTVLAYKLLLQTGKTDDPLDHGRIGCRPSNTPCDRVNIVRLVSDDGIIREDAFYNYLSAWVGNDPLTYSASQAQIRPAPEAWFHIRKQNEMIISRSPDIYFAQMPFYLNNMRETEDFVTVINWIRSLINDVETETGIEAYPSGYPFLYWQQYVTLRYYLFLSLLSVICAAFLVLSVVLINPWAAAIMAFFLAVIAIELFGFMGFAGVKLSAVPAVILVASIGLGVAFTVHIVFAFITSCGTRKERSRYSIGHMLNPVVDGAVSTMLGVVMLAGAEFDFIVIYFFQVLMVLIVLGLLNGLVLLPVVLSFIGPPSEVVPTGGGSRLKTPTPPPSPTMEMDPEYDVHHQYDTPYRYRNRSEHYNCYQRRPATHYHYPHCPGSHYSSRESIHMCPYHQRASYRNNRYFSHTRYRRRHVYPPPRHSRDESFLHPPSDYSCRNLTGNDHNLSCQQHPFQGPPLPTVSNTDGLGQVFVYPRVVYSANATPHHETIQENHCENDNQPTPASTCDVNKQVTMGINQVPTLTATSSLTVRVRPSGRNPVVAFVDPPTTSRGSPYETYHDGATFQGGSFARTSRGHFDISALNQEKKTNYSTSKT